MPTAPTLQFCRPDLVKRSYQPRANISGKSNEWCQRIAVRVECRADLVSPRRCAGVESRMTSRQGTGRGQEPTSKIATPKVPIHRFMNVILRVRDVCFSNRPIGVKRFQTIHQHSVDVARGAVLLFGIGARALPSWVSRTGRNNLLGGLAVLQTAGPSRHTNSPHPSSRKGHHSTAWWSSKCPPILLDPV